MNEQEVKEFKQAWEEVITLLRNSNIDLSKIYLVCKEGMWSDARANKRSS